MLVAHSRPIANGLLPAVGATAAVAAVTALPVLCPFRLCTGHACPFCGMTRAFESLVTGDATTAIRFHPLVLVLVLEAAVIGLVMARSRSRPSSAVMRSLMAVNAVLFAVVWIVRWRLGLLSFVVR